MSFEVMVWDTGGPVEVRPEDCSPYCDDLAPGGWLAQFEGRCYFYPQRDCPAWAPGRLCARIERRIPA